MVMSAVEATRVANDLRDTQDAERQQLDVIRRYWTGRQALPAVIPTDAPAEVRTMARVARVNVISIVVESITQGLFVDNIRVPGEVRDPDNVDPGIAAAWGTWQANGMDRRHLGVHRAATAYGTGYAMGLPGDPVPVIRVFSPRQLTAMYGDDDMWPVYALQRQPRMGRWRLVDGEAVYTFVQSANSDRLEMSGAPAVHGMTAGGRPVCPVVRYLDAEDLDVDDEPEPGLAGLGRGGAAVHPTTMVAGQVAPLIDLQDQINLTSFSLKVAEWYAAFRQRYIIGWTATAEQRMLSAASQLWTFDEDPENVKIGEFQQTELRGYLDSRGDAIRFAATLSQTPVHELTGQLVNLSAEALAAAEIGRDRKVDLRQTGHGESHEQLLRLVAERRGVKMPDGLEVVWRDTSARSFAAVVDGLGKLAQMLQVPARALWDRIPGVTRQDLERFDTLAAEGDAMAGLLGELERQAGGGAPAGERTSPGGIILPPGVQA
jgi:hypothetical protein